MELSIPLRINVCLIPRRLQSLPPCPAFALPSFSSTAFYAPQLREREGKPARLCKCIVYSLATTSDIALLPPAFLGVLGAVEGLLLGIVSRVTVYVNSCDRRASLNGGWSIK